MWSYCEHYGILLTTFTDNQCFNPKKADAVYSRTYQELTSLKVRTASVSLLQM